MSLKTRFNKGFKKNNFLILLIAILLTVLLIYILEIQMEKGLLTKIFSEDSYILNEETDHTAHVTYTLTEYKDSPPDEYTLYFLGGSAARYIFYSQEFTEEKVKQAYGIDINAEVLFSNGQNYLDALLIIENLPENSGAVILTMTTTKLDKPLRSEKMRNMPISGEYYFDLLVETQGWFSNLYRFKSGHIFRRLFDKVFLTLEYEDFSHESYIPGEDIKTIPGEAQKNSARALSQLNAIDETDIEDFDRILAIYNQVCQERGLELILIPIPYDCGLVGEFNYNGMNIHDYFCMKGVEFAEKYDRITCLTYVKDMGLETDDYYDYKHITAEDKRQEYIEGLVDRIGFLFD